MRWRGGVSLGCLLCASTIQGHRVSSCWMAAIGTLNILADPDGWWEKAHIIWGSWWVKKEEALWCTWRYAPGTKTLSSTHDRKADPVLLGSSLTRVRVFYFNQTLNSLLPASFPLPLLIPSLFPLSSVHNMHQYSPLLITFQLHIFSVLKVQSDTHGRKGSTHPTLTKYEWRTTL